MRGQPAPAHHSRQAKLIEITRLVVEDSSPEYKSLPGVRRHFESLQLTNDLERAMLAAHLRPRSDVLPPQQPIHELRGGDRLDLFAQRGDGEPMNPRQQSPFAPFNFRRVRRDLMRRALVWRGHSCPHALKRAK